MEEKAIHEIHKYLDRFPGKKIHILNGEVMLKEFQIKKYVDGDQVVPWNEAMCWGEVTEEIFSHAFIQKRVQSLNTTESEYKHIVLEPLQELTRLLETEVVVCWFGYDMFCQMNLLTCLAYLNQLNYKGKVVCCLFDENNNDETIICKEVEIKKAKECFQQIICQKNETELLPVCEMKQAMIDYLSLESQENEIVDYVKENIFEEKNVLLKQLMAKFQRFGLGDIQYLQIIDQILNK